MTTPATATRVGVAHAATGITDQLRHAAMTYFYSYALQNSHFTGGDVLAAWRQTADPQAHADWRNSWGAVCRMAAKRGWTTKVGRARPTTAQSHATTLVLWESNLCASKTPMPTAQQVLSGLAERVARGELSATDAVWKAYEMGSEESQR